MKNELSFPFYAKASLICLGLFAFIYMLVIAQQILVPLLFATLAAILLSPVINFLVRKRIARVLAISIVLGLLFGLVILLCILLSNQIIRFADSLPDLVAKFNTLVTEAVYWISKKFDITTGEVHLWIDTQSTQIAEGSGHEVGQTLVSTGTGLVFLVLIPVYIFMILLYQPLLLNFVHKLFSIHSQTDVNDVMQKTKKIIQGYLIGLMTEALIVAILYSIALLIIGIQYAILLAIIGALLNLIPYLGSIIAASIPMAVALATETPVYALIVLAAYIFIQLLDNNFIIPKIVASKVRLNALVSIIVVIAGGYLWGIPGMFLAIPVTAILKVIFDHTEGLKPWGYVLGNTLSRPQKKSPVFRRESN